MGQLHHISHNRLGQILRKTSPSPKTGLIVGSYSFSRQGNSLQMKQTEDRPMKTTPSFIKNIVETAANDETVMPWARGARRAAFIAKRNNVVVLRKSA